MTPFPDTWLIVPLYNEATVIGGVIREAIQTFPHVICVDDGSHDNSARLAHEAGAVVISHPINLGQGAALQTGFDYFLHSTDGRYLITFDADGQHQISDAVRMREVAQNEGLAVVLGSRFLGGPSPVGWLKKLVLKTAATVTRVQTGMKLSDAHNGLRLLRRDAVEAVHLDQNRMAHATQIIEQLARSGLPWREIPVHIRYTDYSRSKGQSLWNSVNILVELIMR